VLDSKILPIPARTIQILLSLFVLILIKVLLVPAEEVVVVVPDSK